MCSGLFIITLVVCYVCLDTLIFKQIIMSYAVSCGWTMNYSIPANWVHKKPKNTYSVTVQRVSLMDE